VAVTAARRPNGWFDRLSTVLGLGLVGLPSFWLSGLAILVFALALGWFPASHMHSVDADRLSGVARIADLLVHLVLPAACLGLVGAAGTARYLRSTLIEIRGRRYIYAARARGIDERRVLWVHTLRPALLPVITLLGLSLPFLVSGSVVVETIFAWPGVGLALLQAAQARDLPVIMGVTLLGAAAVLIGSLIADLLYALVDPRAREADR
jgi:peptide/nickel transport system permease protein